MDENKKVDIGLMGLSFGSNNLGCEALALSFYYKLLTIVKDLKMDVRFYVFSSKPEDISFINSKYSMEFIEYHMSKITTIFKSFKTIKKCDLIFDFTEGDSFSDIYGRGRFYRSILLKLFALIRKKRVILGPQTYGPFEKNDCKLFAKFIIEHSYKVFSRDKLSKQYLNAIGINKDISVSTDVAFFLPFREYKNSIKSDEKK